MGLLGPAGISSSVGIGGVVTGNKQCGSLKHWIREFAIKCGHQLNLDRTKVSKSLEDKLMGAMEVGIP